MVRLTLDAPETPLRNDALAIAQAGLDAIDTKQVIAHTVSLQGDELRIGELTYDLTAIERLIVVGVGKCSLDAAEALEAILEDRIAAGMVLDVRCSTVLTRIRSCEGTHPFPSEDNIAHTAELLALVESADKNDLVIFIVSGGGSTLLCHPRQHTCIEEQHLLEHFFNRGVPIEEINVVRKHLSYARGGHVAAMAYPAELVALIFSDVPSNDIATIASGPTVMDTTTIADAQAILRKYDAESVGMSEEVLIETPKKQNYFERVHNLMVLTNETALCAMQKRANELGYTAEIKESHFTGDVWERAPQMIETLRSATAGTVHLYGGEGTVLIQPDVASLAHGGRCQECALVALSHMQEGELFLALASDGRDNSDRAGAIADQALREHALGVAIDPAAHLQYHDSYGFYTQAGGGLTCGFTGTNVSDLFIVLKEKQL